MADDVVERDDAGPDTLRPTVSRPAPRRAARFSDRRHPIRATLALIFLVAFAAVATAGAIGAAIALVALALRSAVGG